MSQIPDLDELVRRAKYDFTPPPAARQRVHARIQGGAAVATKTSATRLRWTIASIVVLGIALTVLFRPSDHERRTPIAKTRHKTFAYVHVPTPPQSSKVLASPSVTAAVRGETRHATEAQRIVRTPQSLPHDHAAPLTSHIDELTLIRTADRALRTGDRDRARSLLDEHARTFANGALSEEREGLRVILTCNEAHNDARAESARAFLSTHPHSPLRARIEHECLP